MSQNLTELRFQYTGEELPLIYQSNGISVYLKLDSKNKVYSYKYALEHNELAPYFEFFGNHLLDEHIEDLAGSFCKRISNSERGELKDKLLWDQSLIVINSAFANALGREQGTQINPAEVVCRCAKVDLAEFKEKFLEVKGSKRDLIRTSNMTMTCGNCQTLVTEIFSELSAESELFLGMEKEEAIELIKHSLIGFKDYSPIPVAEISIDEIEFSGKRVLFRISGVDGSLKEKLEIAMTNYLSGKLKRSIEAVLTIV